MSDLKHRLLKYGDISSRGKNHPQNVACREAAALIKAQDERIKALEAGLSWYREQARLCRLIHSEGDQGRHALADDGGKRAASLLEEKPAVPSVEHITGVALREPKCGTTWVCGGPNRHHDVMALMARDDANPFNTSPHDCQQGFYTSNERFVTRLEAMQIAKAAGQLIRPASGGYQGPELFSEDLW